MLKKGDDVLGTGECFADVRQIRIAHEFTLDQLRKCEYPHGRGSYGFVYILDGEAEYRFFGGECVTASAGDVLFISPDARYAIVTREKAHHYTVNFDLHRESSHLGLLKTPFHLQKGLGNERIEGAFKRIVGAWSKKRAGYEMLAIGVLYELFADFYAACVESADGNKGDRLRLAREYIEKYFDQPITLSQLAHVSNMSITNFRREWSKRYADSPIRYRDSLRLHYAKELLNTGYYSVGEVAAKCGFEDVGYFIRFFRKHASATPHKFKKAQTFAE